MSTAIVWFRRDLRLIDNPALIRALSDHERVIPVYIHAPEEEGDWRPGAASCWWLHRSLSALQEQLASRGSRLVLRVGESLEQLTGLLAESGADSLYWNRLYDPAIVKRDRDIKAKLRSGGVTVWSGNAALLFEPWTIATNAGEPYRVFTPFWKTCRPQLEVLEISKAPDRLPAVEAAIHGARLDELGLLPAIRWDDGLDENWTPGEEGALRNLDVFRDEALTDYSEGRDFPARAGTSRMSPHLHFGEIGPRQVAAAMLAAGHANSTLSGPAEKYLSEIGWREFAHQLLFHFPTTPDQPLNARFSDFPWRSDIEEDLQRWCRGATGIPIVDAGMRELWRTGWMHNRMRMVVGSLLTKNLRIHWQHGARWFWDTLVDADLANNTQGWQWISGCGADAAPYFRVFNPVRQAERFDPDGEYTRRWVPELSDLPDRYLNCPWDAPRSVLEKAGVRLGESYPAPIVDLRESRQQALAAYEKIKSGA